MHVLSIVFVLCGTFFLFTGTIGLLRLPDFYTRMHATAKCDTLGILLVLFGLALYGGVSLGSLKILLIAAFVLLTSPTATHAITRAALKNATSLWTSEKGE